MASVSQPAPGPALPQDMHHSHHAGPNYVNQVPSGQDASISVVRQQGIPAPV